MNIENQNQAFLEHQMLRASAAKIGERLDFYNDVLNRLAMKKANLTTGHPWELEVQEAIDNVHLKIALLD